MEWAYGTTWAGPVHFTQWVSMSFTHGPRTRALASLGCRYLLMAFACRGRGQTVALTVRG